MLEHNENLLEQNNILDPSLILSDPLKALIEELQHMLNVLILSKKPSQKQKPEENLYNRVDLHTLPLNPGDIDILRTILSNGEVIVTVNTFGRSTITETAVPGIWWINHYNEHNKLIGELIEVSEIPSLLKVQPEDIENAEDIFKTRIKLVSGENN